MLLINPDGTAEGVVPLRQALERAEEYELDLVEINATATPPVCKILDYGKSLYDDQKRSRASKKKQVLVQVKEVKFRPGTDAGDYQVKLRKLRRFLEQGNKAKVSLRFRGREMSHQELGKQLLERIGKDLEDLGGVEQHPKLEGRQLIMVVAPKRRPEKPREPRKESKQEPKAPVETRGPEEPKEELKQDLKEGPQEDPVEDPEEEANGEANGESEG